MPSLLNPYIDIYENILTSATTEYLYLEKRFNDFNKYLKFILIYEVILFLILYNYFHASVFYDLFYFLK